MNTPKDFGGFACITEAEQLLDAIESGDLEQIPQLADNLRCALSYTKLDTPRMSEEFNLLLTILRYGPDKKKEKEGRAVKHGRENMPQINTRREHA